MIRTDVAAGGVRFALWRADPPRRRRTTPVLLLHGVPQTALMWRDLAAELGRDRTVLAPDLKGLGDSELAGPYDVPTMVGELAALALHEADGVVDVVGHDWGGVLALGLARRRPELVRRLVLAAAPYGRPDYRRAWHVPAFALPVLPELAFALGGAGLVRAMLRYGWRSPTPLAEDAAARYAAAYTDPARVAAMLGYYRAGLRGVGARLRLAGEHRPAPPRPVGPGPARSLVLWGAADPVLPVALAEAAARRLGPAATLVVVPGAGHFVVEEAPRTAVESVAEFLRAA